MKNTLVVAAHDCGPWIRLGAGAVVVAVGGHIVRGREKRPGTEQNRPENQRE